MNSDGDHKRVGFIGAGKMATALAQGMCRSGFTTPDRIAASDVAVAAREAFVAQTGACGFESNVEILAGSEVVILAVKPQHFHAVLGELRAHISPQHLVVSIAAGIPIAAMAAILGSERRLVRVMPNTPCLVGASASAYCLGGAASAEDGRLVERLLNAVGVSFELPEHLLDSVTGLSGSGPAFVSLV